MYYFIFIILFFFLFVLRLVKLMIDFFVLIIDFWEIDDCLELMEVDLF